MGTYCSEQKCLTLDIILISSYSNLIVDVESGYNRDGEALYVNCGEESCLPVYQKITAVA